MQSPSLNRRDVLKVSLAGTAAMALPYQAVLSARTASELDQKKMPRPYVAAFTAPPVLAPYRSDDKPGNSYGTVPGTTTPVTGGAYVGTDYYRIEHRPAQVEFIKGVKTTVWGYNGLVPGPTIRVYQNGTQTRRVVMQQINKLPAKHPTLGYVPWTSTHLHGSPSKPQFDGYAGDLTQPGEWKNYMYPNNCSPRTLWYHDHGVHHTAQNVYMGLAAQYHVVDEQLERDLGIPRYDRAKVGTTRPQYEFPLIISDVMFARNGQLMWDDDGESGLYGDVILVNGVPWPTMKVEPRKYRFRVLNGSLARGYTLKLSNGKPFTVIATDGGFMPKPQTVTTLTIGMAERYEIVIDFADLKGTKVQLLNGGVKNARDYDHTGKVMQFEVGTTVTSTEGNSIPSALGPVHPTMTLDPAAAVATRRMELERSNGLWVINGETWDDVVKSKYEHVFANVAPNSTEIWEVHNSSGGWFHPLHVHLIDFQVLSRNGRPPRPEELGPKDVVYVGEGETVRLLMRFDHEEGRYMIHCHNLSHEDHDMMTQYQVGHHDIDCDSINTAPPKGGTPDEMEDALEEAAEEAEELAEELVESTPPATTGTTSTGTTGTTGTGSTGTTTVPAPTTPTPAAPTTSAPAGGGGTTTAPAPAPAPTSASTTPPRRRSR
ncbi:Multicopper oxidase with three cupredoxin domains (includes cell division protein FtsP and spore coat protein CotA) [Geodermatophilus africanus]|uniref:Multicopper oxidase with three cupredoxin domains (Includes cell division protein FtsP and spore coat protein CotA) n=1 Tax=Geodermatophilus africanus TaxID=1137993 RepID=A0A1H3M3W5_9ACTN|nr:multicopper oxidase domain-containing protein [Geodermatophilus africanus]SDY71391.1 Multicopper oxidase with three cupredoxin domains (includes cell division protein FtsP and spore coat protein CotA) [Geodermatophilus africanus]